MSNNIDSKRLVIAAKNGDIECFEELYKLYYDKIYALALTIVKNSADAEDVLQVTFVKAWQNIEKLENVSAFNTWLQRIAINQCNSMLRKSNKQEYSINDEGDDGELLQIESDLMLPEQYAERDDLSIRLRAIIDELSVVQRETILLYYYNELSVEEIAQIMDCSEGTVKSRLFLARKAIKTEIEEQEKKTGEKFYGIAGVALIPFGGLFIREIKRIIISGNEAANIYSSISNTLFNSPLIPATSVTSGTVASTATTVAKSVFPLWAKIVSIITAVGLLTGGGIVAWNLLAPKNPIINAAVGDEFIYGQYEQDNNIDNGVENITWRVLEREDDKLLVVSKYVLDCITYEEYDPGYSWSDSELSYSLDSDFFNTAFTEEEQRYISDTYVFSDEGRNSDQEDTVVVNKVFILNEYETNQYFSSNDDRIAYATEYAFAQGTKVDENNHAIWWLRSRAHENHVDAVYEDGYVDNERGGFSGDSFGLRPAMWIDAGAMVKKQKAENKIHPIDTSYLNNSLHRFLGTFALHFSAGTYNCESITEDSNILHGVIGEAECISYGLYSEALAVANSYDNWIDAREIPSPIKDINDNDNPIYKKLDAKTVDDILVDIFHCTDNDIQRMRGWQSDWNPYGYSDGYYYCSTGGHGDIGNEFTFIDGSYKDGCCYYSLNFYDSEALWKNNFSIEGIAPTTTIYVKVSLAAHEGIPWWTLYYYSQNPISSESKNNNETASPVQADNETTETNNNSWSGIYRNFIINKEYLSSSEGWLSNDALRNRFSDDLYPYFYLYDLNDDNTPELFMSFGYINGSTPQNVYTVKDDKLVFLSDIFPSADLLIYNKNSSNNGLFCCGGRQGAYSIQYWYMIGDSIESTQVLSETAKNISDLSEGFNLTVRDQELYDTFIGCTKDNPDYSAVSFRLAKNDLPEYNRSQIESIGWESIVEEYGY